MTPTELMQGGHGVEAQGIPVDWKELAMKLFQLADSKIKELEVAAKEQSEELAKRDTTIKSLEVSLADNLTVYDEQTTEIARLMHLNKQLGMQLEQEQPQEGGVDCGVGTE